MICYQTLASLMTYVLVAHDRPQIQVYNRLSDAEWRYSIYQGLEAVITLSAIDCQLRLADVYARVEFEVDGEAGSLVDAPGSAPEPDR